MSPRQRFEADVLPHLGAAYNLARWLLRDERAAEDAVQEASLRAFRYLGALREGDGRPWLLGIVRNTCFTLLESRRNAPPAADFDEAAFEAELEHTEPPARLQQQRTKLAVDAAIRALSPPLREVIVLRELEELEYAQIAAIAGVPVGTVMSRLSRAREQLRRVLSLSRLGPTS